MDDQIPRQLFLLRHGKSDWNAGTETDHERPLNERGRLESSRAGRFLVASGIYPDLVLCSTARRTRETLEFVQGAAEWGTVPVVFLEALYLAPIGKAIDVLTEYLSHVRTLLLIGHQPTLSGTVSFLTDGTAVDIPTATIAALKVDVPVRQHCSELMALVTPRQFNTTTL